MVNTRENTGFEFLFLIIFLVSKREKKKIATYLAFHQPYMGYCQQAVIENILLNDVPCRLLREMSDIVIVEIIPVKIASYDV